MDGLLHVRVPLLTRRVVTLIPALIIVGVGIEPTLALVWSQALLSVGIPFAIVPLFLATGSRKVMGKYADGTAVKVLAFIIAALVIVLNIALLVLTAMGIG